MDFRINNTRIIIEVGDITEVKTDAIVNAAKSSLLGGGGVDGAIHRRAGPELLEACRSIGGCPAGDARITKAYMLSANFVIHTVGPVYHDGKSGEKEILTAAYQSSLKLADENHVRTIAFPAISTGVYAYPMEKAAEVSLKAIAEYLNKGSSIETITIVLFNKRYFEIYSDVISRLF